VNEEALAHWGAVAPNKNVVYMWGVGVVLWPLFITREEASGTRAIQRSEDSTVSIYFVANIQKSLLFE